ncbi:MAG TPA: hypothetical protein ENK57_07080 [Polyangiaceae bacterium]|nr:hypothetical protein [Polyangiaceae bacterium]
MRRHRETSRPRAVRAEIGGIARFGVLVAVCAVLTVATLSVQTLHMTLVAHAVCPDHGGMVHGTHDEPHQAERALEGPEASAHREASHHDHCDAPGVMATLVPHPPPLALVHLTSLPAGSSTGVDVIPSRRRRLLFAPKTPPPV